MGAPRHRQLRRQPGQRQRCRDQLDRRPDLRHRRTRARPGSTSAIPRSSAAPTGYSLALAYGAPDPSAPEGVGNLGNFIYVGTQAGQIYVTQDGGGSGTSNNWINISTGLGRSPSS